MNKVEYDFETLELSAGGYSLFGGVASSWRATGRSSSAGPGRAGAMPDAAPSAAGHRPCGGHRIGILRETAQE